MTFSDLYPVQGSGGPSEFCEFCVSVFFAFSPLPFRALYVAKTRAKNGKYTQVILHL